jgi:dipeptidase E
MVIIAIGGGEITGGTKEERTDSIDREIVKKSGKKNPGLLFIPAASGDSKIYCRNANDHFGVKLGCDVRYLMLYEKPGQKEIRRKIQEAEIIYVGGGNTYRMMKLWRKTGVDKLLAEAGERGAVLSGMSAGAICWFRYGLSDSWKFNNPQADSIRVRGTGMVDMLLCPHYSTEQDRKFTLMKMMKRTNVPGLALDDCCAIEIEDGRYRTLSSNDKAQAYKVYWGKDGYVEEAIEQSSAFRNLEELTVK